ncbi:MAG: hypothetical protein KF773_26595 [Deltaproteobacteria bacterium]|nr:hypothetical protein [Deltaproteobacteria bacterium]MCW5803419.1 hypothetical protein [Deltaproteobacteria bacterium]
MACASVVACWSNRAEVSSPQQTAVLRAPGSDLIGPYWCSITSDGYENAKYACIIKKVGETLTLAKVGGSERIRGTIMPDERDGFSFVGEMYCPWGECTQQLRGRFRPAKDGGFKGTFRENESTMVLHLVPAAANAFGGPGYGGDEYAWGGAAYGGYSYAGTSSRFDSRGRRRP